MMWWLTCKVGVDLVWSVNDVITLGAATALLQALLDTLVAEWSTHNGQIHLWLNEDSPQGSLTVLKEFPGPDIVTITVIHHCSKTSLEDVSAMSGKLPTSRNILPFWKSLAKRKRRILCVITIMTLHSVLIKYFCCDSIRFLHPETHGVTLVIVCIPTGADHSAHITELRYYYHSVRDSPCMQYAQELTTLYVSQSSDITVRDF